MQGPDWTGRVTRASADGIAGLVAVVDGQPQFLASDEVGRLWNRLFVNGAAVSTTNPLPTTPGAGVVQMVEGDIAHDDPDLITMFPVKIGGRASAATPAAVANGDRVNAYFDLNGRLVVLDEAVHPGEDDTNNVLGVTTKPLAISTYAPLLASSLGGATDINVKAAPGNLMALSGENRNGATRYLQLHNLAGAIGGGAVPIYVWPVPSGTVFGPGTDFFTIPGIWFSTGIRVGWSTTEHTYTAATAADHTTFAHYI